MATRRMNIFAVNVATAQATPMHGRRVMTAIAKRSVTHAVAVKPLGLAGDEQADLSVHGGLSKAVYAYPMEHLAFWEDQRTQALGPSLMPSYGPGSVGENLSLTGLLETELWIGDALHLPNTILTVSEPRMPCFKFNAAMGFPGAAKAMMQSGFCGAYLSVQQPGSVTAGEAFTLVPGPREVRLLDMFRAKSRT
jgi:MOSC domain-containing protein YiiM